MTEDERWTAVLLPPSPVVDAVEDTGNDTPEDTGNDTAEDNGKDTGKDTDKDTGKDTADNAATGGVGKSAKSSETVEQFISRLGLNRDEAEVVEDLLKTHDFVKEKDLIESVIRTAKA